MGLVRTQRVGDGATIIGNGRTIDLVITDIGRVFIDNSSIDSGLKYVPFSEARHSDNNQNYFYKIALVRVSGAEDIGITPSEPQVLIPKIKDLDLGDGVVIGLIRSNSSPYRVSVLYQAGPEYIINRNEYNHK